MAEQQCLNLRRRLGDRYHIRYEESYFGQHGRGARIEDPWYMILLCRYGHIYPYGQHVLAVSVDGHSNVVGQIRRLKCCQVTQQGDAGELTALFDVADFDQVAGIMQPRKRAQPQLSPEQREAKRQAMERVNAQRWRRHPRGQESTITT